MHGNTKIKIKKKNQMSERCQHRDFSFSNFIVKNSTTIFSVPSKHMRV